MITQKINFHTHCTFCDGKNTPEEIILSAIQKKFTVLGFSSHSMTPYSSDWHLPPQNHDNYVNTIHSLAEKYKNQIEILCGFEVDYIKDSALPSVKKYQKYSPDFIIGSVHYLGSLEQNYTVDDSTELVKEGLERIYKNDGKKVVCEYFECQREMLKKGNFQIWGHPDLVRKRNGILHFFDENESWYKDQIKETIKIAKKTDVVAEINSGAISRKCMDDFYPSKYFLTLLYEAKIPVCLSSDAHSADALDCSFERAMAEAKEIGYTELFYPTTKKTYNIKL